MKLKVCGLSKISEVETCIEENVNYCGFILNYPKSHRFISFEIAKKLTSIKKNFTEFVGVLVNPSEDELKKFSELKVDYFQLYGNYNDLLLKEIKKKYKKKIISSLQIKKFDDVDNYKKIENNSDIILWDSSGFEESISWNYNWIKNVSIGAEKMIGGNITEDKIYDLKDLADIIDVSGALETNKVKDINKIKHFVKNIKEINNEY